MSEKETVVEKLYLHINNGGVTFKVVDSELGPTIEIEASSFGHITNGVKLYVTPDVLFELSDVFRKAARYDYEGRQYCAAINKMYRNDAIV